MRSLTALFLLACLPAFAETAPGYVVKFDSGLIYLDFNEKTGAAKGQAFQVFTEGEELKHPVTGASLGKLENKVAEGTLTEVLAQYSVGKVDGAPGEIKPGMKARLSALPPQTAPAPVQQPQVQYVPVTKPGAVAERAPRWKSMTFPYQIGGMAVAEFEAGTLTTAMTDGRKIFLYAYPPVEVKPKVEWDIPNSAMLRVMSMEAADVNGNGKAELFITVYNQTFHRLETNIYELAGDKWTELQQVPLLVRSIQDPAGKTILATQQLLDDVTFPFSGIYPLSYQEGKYAAGKGSLKPKRVDWIYDFTNATLDQSPAALYLTTLGHIRVQFEKGSWKTKESYSQTPVRLRWPNSNGKLLEFHPQMRVTYDSTGKAAIYAARNLSMLGSLSEPFGLFNNGELHRKSWDGVALVSDWKAELGGYAPSIAVVGPADKRDIAVAIVGTSGRSAVWIYDP
jgi:hypothetical protein